MIKALHFLNESDVFLYLALTVSCHDRRLSVRIYDRCPPNHARLVAPGHSLSWLLDLPTRERLAVQKRLDIIDHCRNGLPLYSCRSGNNDCPLATVSQPPVVWPP